MKLASSCLRENGIIDASEFPFLGTRVRALLEQGSPRSDVDILRKFLKVAVDLQVDFETWDDNARKRLFVGMTRAQLAIEIVLSPTAEHAMNAVLQR